MISELSNEELEELFSHPVTDAAEFLLKLDPEELEQLFAFGEFGGFVTQFQKRIPNSSKACA